MANKFLKRAMEIVKFDIEQTGKEYASNLIKLKNDAKAVASQMQGESTVMEVQSTFKRMKSGNIIKDISNWFYNNADEFEAESLKDDDFDFGGPSDDMGDEDKPKLSIPSSSESSKQLAAMYKIGAKQAEAALANTAELVTTINTRSSEIISAVNNVNSTLGKINSTLENKLEKLIQLSTVQIEAQTERYRNDGMTDDNGRLTLSKMYETFKSSNIVSSNPYVSMFMTMLPSIKQDASPENIFNMLMSMGRESITVKGRSINDWGKSFNDITDAFTQRMMRSFMENPTIKKYFFNREQGTGGSTDYSQYRVNNYNTERALFDNKTRQTIIDIIPGYLKSIDNALNHRELHINEYGKLTTENVQVNKFNAVTDKAISSQALDYRRMEKIASKIEDESGVKYNQDELDIALKALQATYVMYLERSGGSMLKVADLNPDDMATINYAVKLIKTARGGSPQYWKTLCQTLLLKLSGNIIDGERFIQSVSRSLINMRQEAIEVAQGDYGDQAGTITDQMMKNTFRNLSDGTNTGNRKHRSEGGTSSSGGTPPTGGGNPPDNKPPSVEADAFVDNIISKITESRVGQILGLGSNPAGTDAEGNKDYIGQITSVAGSVKDIGTNLASAAKDTIKTKGNELIGKAKEAATDKMHEIAETVAFKGVQQDFNKENLSKSTISDEDKLLVQQIMQMAQTATADGDVSQSDIQAIKQMIDQIQDANTKKRLNQSIIPMLNRVSSKNSEDGSGQNKGIVGKILAGVTLAFNKILTPIKAIIKLGFKGLKTVATKLFAPIIKLFKSGASDVISGGSALKESLFGSTDEEGNKTDGLMQTFITNPAKSVFGVGKSIVSALHTGVVKPLGETFKNIFAERDKQEKEKPSKEEGAEKATDKVVDKFKDFMNSSEFGKGFMSVFNKEEEKKKAAKLKTPESMSDVATNEMSEMVSGKKESVLSVIRDAILEVAENTGSKSGKKGKKSSKSKTKELPTTASEAVAGGGEGEAGGKKGVSSLFNIGKMLGGITKILGGFGKMILSAIAGLSGVKAIMTLVEKALSKAVKPLNKAFNAIKKVITPIINTISTSLTKVMDTVSKMAISVVKVLQPIFENIGPIIEMLFDAINPLLEAITPILAPALEVVVSILKPALMILTPTLNIITGILKTVSGSLKFIVGGVKYIVGALKHDNNLKEEGKVLVENGLDNIKDGLGSTFNPTGAKVEEETTTASAAVQQNTSYEPIKGNVLDGTLTGSGDYNSVAEATAAPIVSVLREELIPQIKPIVEIMSKWLTPVLVNIDKALSTVGSFVKTFTSGFSVLKGAVMTGVGFLIQGFDQGKLLKAGVSAIKQGFSDAFSSWKEGVSSVVKNIPVVGDIIDVYTDEEGNEVQVLDEAGSGNMASYGTYMNMSQRGCGPLALSENINRRGGRISAMSLAGGMGANGSYDPNRGTSVNGYINTARSMGMNLTPGTVTRESLMTASARNPITVLGSGSSYGTQSGNNHYVNVVGSRGSQVYVSNPLTGRISRENASDFIAGSKVGLYGSGDFSFSEDVTDAMSELKELTSGIFDIFKFDDDSDSYASIQEQQKESEAATAANELLGKQGLSLDSYEEKAYEKFKQDHPQHVWQSDKSYAKKWAKVRNKYLLEAAQDDINTAYQAEYSNREADSDYDADGGILSNLVNGAKNFFSGLTNVFKDKSTGSKSGSSATAEKFISQAESDVGKYRTDVGCIPSGDWCSNYVSTTMKRAGYEGPSHDLVGYLLKAMEDSVDWEKVDKSEADRGDVIFFDWENPNPFDGSDSIAMQDPQRRWDHVGWVLSNDGNGGLECIEGNAGGEQHVTKQSRSGAYIDTIMRFIADRTGGDDAVWDGVSEGKINAPSGFMNLSGFGSGYRNDAAAIPFVKKGLSVGLSPAQIATIFATGLWEDSCRKLFGTKSLTDVTYDYNGQAAVGLLNFVDVDRVREYGSTIEDQLRYIKDTYFAENPVHSRGLALDAYRSDYPWGRGYQYWLNSRPNLATGTPIGPEINKNLLMGSSYFVGGAVVPEVAKVVAGDHNVMMKYAATAADIYNWMIDNGLVGTVGNSVTATDLVGTTGYADKMNELTKNLPNTSYGVASAVEGEQEINTGYQVLFVPGTSFQHGVNTIKVSDVHTKEPWVVRSITADGKYNLQAVDSKIGLDGIPKKCLTVYKNWDTINSETPEGVASLYGGGGDISSFYEQPIDVPTYQPSYQVINSSYDNMSREQMIQAVSQIEFNVRARHLEALVEQVIEKMDNIQNTSSVSMPITKKTSTTQSMFNEEIPNQLMKLYT